MYLLLKQQFSSYKLPPFKKKPAPIKEAGPVIKKQDPISFSQWKAGQFPNIP